MAIPNVPLNIDSRGYAGSLVSPLSAPGLTGSNYQPGGGGRSGIYNLLAQQAKLRNAMAKAQLGMMREDLSQKRRAGQRTKRGPDPQREAMLLAANLQRSNERQRQREQQGAAAEWARTAMESSPGRAHALEGGQSGAGRLLAAANLFGPDALHRGMMQTGQLLSLGGASGRRKTGRGGYYGGGGGGGAAPTSSSPYSFAGIAPGSRASEAPESGFMAPIPTDKQNVQPGQTFRLGYKKGSLPGTVPKTDTYKLHKGEVVLQAEQVDEPLLYFLVQDKLRKGLAPKPKQGKSYQTGSITYPEGALEREDILRLMDDGGYDPMDTASENVSRAGSALGGVAEYLPFSFTNPFTDERSIGERFGAGLREQMTPPEWIGDFAKDFGKGFSGPPPSLEDAMAKAQQGGTPEPLPVQRSTAPRQAQLEKEVGSRSKQPFLRGDENLAPEDRYFAPESGQWREAQHKKTMAALNRMKADRLANYVQSNPRELMDDPDLRKSLDTEIKRLDQLADMEDQRQERRKARAQTVGAELEKAWTRFRSEAVKAQLKGEQEDRESARQAYQELVEQRYSVEQKLAEEDDPETRGRLARTLAPILAQLEGGDPEQVYQGLAETYDF